jgi:hypothetical protein
MRGLLFKARGVYAAKQRKRGGTEITGSPATGSFPPSAASCPKNSKLTQVEQALFPNRLDFSSFLSYH